jgi:hypothetical protein
VDFKKLRASHDVGGYLFSVVGVLYAVLLGLVVVDALEKFQTARDATEREANSLVDVFMLSSTLPEPLSSNTQKLCVNYANDVINREWISMGKGTYDPQARHESISLMKSILSFEPKTENQKALFPQMVSATSELWHNRRDRINKAVYGVPIIEWVVLILGAGITIFFTYFFSIDSLRLQIIMTSLVAMIISLNLTLLLWFGYPFSGDIRIHPDSFALDQGIFANRIANQASTLSN